MVMSRNVMTRHHVNTTGLAVAEWQSIPDLFTGSGDSYVSCASYTCGQWTLFHMILSELSRVPRPHAPDQ